MLVLRQKETNSRTVINITLKILWIKSDNSLVSVQQIGK